MWGIVPCPREKDKMLPQPRDDLRVWVFCVSMGLRPAVLVMRYCRSEPTLDLVWEPCSWRGRGSLCRLLVLQAGTPLRKQVQNQSAHGTAGLFGREPPG